ncbi:heme ABC exporter ATP-binding protein CcmA [Desulfovibrio aerotolerans]|uniref:Heme ABC exporter ATP-binding protein CcmA n=1 Tax=Solidesulfovibrio aerotolerans TaxID=295255 RepID=A0A7C9IKS1_9BACT|nr:heme ABC exporter ATP-binding protein CcmA [Solidesulfovibrio aerotolerans]MYL82664.1 heme ABC exporter ATP-binding protein CcmA [Solidesulfovibrio aerotolerans]
MAQGLLRLCRVSRFYGERAVLRNIELVLAPGQALLVVGPNGAGKSTLLRLLAGLLPPSEGEITTELAPGEIGYLGHKTLIYPKLTARANLAFWQAMFGLPRDDAPIEAVLARVGLSRFADEEAGVFSRGMSQRLSLARVFLTGPRLLLLDEPASGLDPASAAMLRREIRAAADAGAAVAWVSHNVAADLAVCDRVVLLRGCRVAYDGPARDFDPSGLAGECVC